MAEEKRSSPERLEGVLLADHFRVRERLDIGGQAIVYVASDLQLAEDVVVKVPRREVLDLPEFQRFFETEIADLVALRHPYVVPILARGEVDGIPFMVQQLYRGGSLKERLKKGAGRRQTIAEVLQWLPGVATALDFIHSQGYVHLDVKPGNILFAENGHVALTDFGISKALRATTTSLREVRGFGTPDYMAPEQVDLGLPLTSRADQYALAATVYEALTGRVPVPGGIAAHVAVDGEPRARLRIEHPSRGMAELPERVGDALLRALSWEPADRFERCGAFLDAVRAGLRMSPRARLALRAGLVATMLVLGTALGLMLHGLAPPSSSSPLHATPPPGPAAPPGVASLDVGGFYEARSHARRTLEQARAALEGQRQAEEAHDPSDEGGRRILEEWRRAIDALDRDPDGLELRRFLEETDPPPRSAEIDESLLERARQVHRTGENLRARIAALDAHHRTYVDHLCTRAETELARVEESWRAVEGLKEDLAALREDLPAAGACPGLVEAFEEELAVRVFGSPAFRVAADARDAVQQAVARKDCRQALERQWAAILHLQGLRETGADVVGRCRRAVAGCVFVEAAAAGDVAGVRDAIATGLDPNGVVDSEGRSALDRAAEAFHVEVIRVLLDAKARKERPAKDGRPTPFERARAASPFREHAHPLHAAVGTRGQEAVALTLALLTTSPDEADEAGERALHVAARRGREDLVRALLGSRASTFVVDRDGRTPLHELVWADQQDIGDETSARLVPLLADPRSTVQRDLEANCRRTPLHLAVARDRSLTLVALLAAHTPVDVTDGSGETPLHTAAQEGTAATARILLDAGADLRARNPATQFTPLHKAAFVRNAPVVEVLVGAARDRRLEGYADQMCRGGHTALHFAAANGDADSVRALLRLGPDLEARNDEGRTPLSLVPAGQRAVLEPLLRPP